MNVKFETTRFILREITEADIPNFFALDSDPEVHKYLGGNPIKNIEESEKMVSEVLKQYKEFGIGRLAVVEKGKDNFIGWSGLKYETGVRDNAYYDIGFRLKKEYWGKGIGTETAIASLKYGFNDLNIPEIFGGAQPENIGSNKILQKLGMKCTGVIEYEKDKYNWYEISREEWLKNNNS